MLILLLSVGFAGCLDNDPEDDIDPIYRQRMREFVIGISEFARNTDTNFILIPQNGHELLLRDKNALNIPPLEYIKAIDGLGQEDLLYGYNEDDMKTSEEDTEYLQGLLDIGEEDHLETLVTDYCWTHDKMDDSYERNEAKGYISFAADHRDLDNIPDHPNEPYNLNDNNITTLYEAMNFLYLLDASGYDTRIDYLEALRNTNYDLLILDAFFEDGTILTYEEVSSLKVKMNGGTRLVISYMSIGEAEDYRYYWKDEWKAGNPKFIDKENPDWEGNYKVKYWEPEWQELIYGNQGSYTNRLLLSGFDGVYMDIIDAFEYYERSI